MNIPFSNILASFASISLLLLQVKGHSANFNNQEKAKLNKPLPKNFIKILDNDSFILPDGRLVKGDGKVCKRGFFGLWKCKDRFGKAIRDKDSGEIKLKELLVTKNWDIYYANGLVHHSDGSVSIKNEDCWGNLLTFMGDQRAKVKLANFRPKEFPCCQKIALDRLFCMYKDGTFSVILKTENWNKNGKPTFKASKASQSNNCQVIRKYAPDEQDTFDYYNFGDFCD